MWPKRGLFQGREWRNVEDSSVRRTRDPEVPNQSPQVVFFSHFPLLTWPTSLPTAIWESFFSKYYCKMNVFDFDLQENYFLNVTTPYLSDLLPDLSYLSH